MYEYIKGTLVSSSPSKIIVETSGIGYSLSIPLSAYSKLPKIGSTVHFFVSFIVREDSQRLYAFLTEMERNFFDLLHTVSGIGPKTALSLLGHLSLTDLEFAIQGHNVKQLCRVPGIGTKTAERLIIELKGKCLESKQPMAAAQENHVTADAINALVHLGYQPALAEKTISSLVQKEKEPLDLSRLITKALQTIR